jgi:hypothetical protein
MKVSVLATMVATLLIGFPLAAMAGVVADTDNDGVVDPLDNCVTLANAAPLNCDVDIDGYGNICDADLNNDFVVGGPDFGIFGMAFGMAGANIADLNCDLVVGGPDFGVFGMAFGMAPGPSGKACAGNVGACP